MNFPDFLSNLNHVATSPLALVAYVAVVGAWVYVAVARHRLTRVAGVLKDLPAGQRKDVLIREYATAPRAGLSADQWITSRRHMLFFLGFLAAVICATLVVVVALTLSAERRNAPATDSAEMARLVDEQNRRIAELEARLDRAEAAAGDIRVQLDAPASEPIAGDLVADLAAINDRYDPPDPKIAATLADPLLSDADKVTRASLLLMRRVDDEIRQQAAMVDSLGTGSPDIDVETMKLKRLIDHRSQMFDVLRLVVDRYNENAKAIIDSIGR